MADPRQVALIHAEIDGELDAVGRAELARWMLVDSDGRMLREDLRRLCEALDSLPAVEPPEGFRASVLAALPHTYAPRRRTWTPGWRYAALAAGVVLAAIIVLQTVRGPGPAPAEVAGTMSAPAATRVDTVQLANGPVSGHVSLYRDASGLGLEFELVASSPVEVLVTAAGQTVRLKGLAAKDKPLGPTTVALRGVPRDVPTVDVAFLMGGHQVGSATLHTAGGH